MSLPIFSLSSFILSLFGVLGLTLFVYKSVILAVSKLGKINE